MNGIPAWSPTWEYTGDLEHVRILPGRLAASPIYSCAELDAKKARPEVLPVRPKEWAEPPRYADVAIAIVRDVVLDHVARGAAPTAESIEQSAIRCAAPREVAPATMLAVQAAVSGYREILKELRASGAIALDAVLCRDLVVAEPAGRAGVVEWAAWGLHWIDRSGVRETHLLVWRSAGSRPRPDAALGVVLRSVAEGFWAEPLGSWSHVYTPASFQPPAPSRVRVRELGLLDSSTHLVFEGSPQEAVARFHASVPSALPRLAGGAFNPGGGCAACSIRPECRALPRLPGALSVAARADRLRRLSTSDLWKHESCPHQVHLMADLGLPREPVPELEASTRGRLVHAWLEAAHSRAVPCTDDDVPTAADTGSVGRALGWTGEEAALVSSYLAHHVELCPLALHDAATIRPECPITVHDTDADVIVSTRPDLVLRTAEGGLVVRETKTLTRWRDDGGELDLLHGFPQVATAIALLAEGIDPLDPQSPADPDRSLVELELLGPSAGQVIPYPVSDPDVVLAARVALAERVDAWLHDDEHPPRPGRQCERCPVRSWCVASVMADAQLVSPESDGGAPASGIPLDVLALIEADSGLSSDEEFPF